MATAQAPIADSEANSQPQTPSSSGTIIQPPKSWQLVDLAELWKYRELMFFLTWRDVKVRYKQTMLGALWALIQPFMMMVVFTIVLGRMAKMDSGGLPYPVFVYAGLLPWTFFSSAISSAATSVVGANQVITKVYFPRLIVPFASVGSCFVDFFVAFSLLILLMVVYGVAPTWNILWVPPLLILVAIAALGVGSLLSALNVAYRDFRYTVSFLVQLWLFATPTVYMAVDNSVERVSLAPESTDSETATPTNQNAAKSIPVGVQALLRVNPMTGLIGFFRAATLGGRLPWNDLAYSTAVIGVLFVIGVGYFRRVEHQFADII